MTSALLVQKEILVQKESLELQDLLAPLGKREILEKLVASALRVLPERSVQKGTVDLLETLALRVLLERLVQKEKVDLLAQRATLEQQER